MFDLRAIGLRFFVLGLLVWGLPGVQAPVLSAQETSAEQVAGDKILRTALDIAPANSAVFMSSMNHERIVEAIQGSRAMAHLRESPAGVKLRKAWRKGRSAGFDQFGDNPFTAYLSFYEETFSNPAVMLAWPFIDEALKKELFFFADENLVKWSEAINAVYYQLMDSAANAEAGNDPAAALLSSLPALIKEKTEGLKIPVFAVGCVLDDPANYRGLLQTADSLLRQGLKELPADFDFIPESYKFEVTDRMLMLSFSLSGDDIPWDMILEESGAAGDDDTLAMIEQIEEITAGRTLTVSLSIQDHLMMLAISPDRETLLGLKDGWLLVDLPRMAPLREARAAGHELVWASWVSEAANALNANYAEGFRMIPGVMRLALSEEAGDHPRNEDLIAAVEKDIEQLAQDMSNLMPAQGAMMSVAWLSNDGVDGLSVRQLKNSSHDEPAALTTLDRIGPDPMLVYASRTNGSAAQFAIGQKWVDRAFYYAEEFVPDYLDASTTDVAMTRKGIAGFKKLWQQYADATAKDLIPAMEDCDNALVIDLASRKRQWHALMNDVGVEVPIPSVAVVMGIKDREAVLRAGTRYWGVVDEGLKLIRELVPADAEFPVDFEGLDDLIDVRSSSGDARTTFDFRLKIPEAGIDDLFQPQIVVAEKVMWMTSHSSQGQRLKEKPAKMFGPAGDGQPASAVFYMDFNALVDATDSWMRYGVEMQRRESGPLALKNEADSDLLDFTEEELLSSADAARNFLKCFKGISTSMSNKGENSTVRFQFRFEDLPDTKPETTSANKSGREKQ